MASIQPKIEAEAEHGFDKDVETEKVIVQPEIEIEAEARHDFDKEDARTEKFDDNFNWIAEVQHPILLDVLNFKKNKVQDSGATKTETGNEKGIEELPEKELDMSLGDEVEAGEGEVDYDGSSSSFLKFYWNLIVDAKKGALTNEEIVFEMNKIIPNFLVIRTWGSYRE
ncbi:hypothetical protein AgCh_019626 [Apium graveolens]